MFRKSFENKNNPLAWNYWVLSFFVELFFHLNGKVEVPKFQILIENKQKFKDGLIDEWFTWNCPMFICLIIWKQLTQGLSLSLGFVSGDTQTLLKA